MLTSFSDLVGFLQKIGPVGSDPATGRAVIPVKSDRIVGEMAIIWDLEVGLIQTVLPLPIAVAQARVPAAESAIAWINHALKFPGFGLDHSGPTLYYRLSFPRHPDGTFDEEELQHMVGTTITTAEDFVSALKDMVEHDELPERALANVKQPPGSSR